MTKNVNNYPDTSSKGEPFRYNNDPLVIIGRCYPSQNASKNPIYSSPYPAVYCVALIKSKGSSLVVTHRTADVRVTSDRPGTP